MKIYTRTGDEGETGLFAGPRVSKCDERIEAYGTIDELNAVLGVVRAEGPPSSLDEILARIQNTLFVLGAELATPEPAKLPMRLTSATEVSELEQMIDVAEEQLEPLREFILPGGSQIAASLHFARSVCRRAEREVVRLVRRADAAESPHVVTYLNRLSDLLFVLARQANQHAGVAETPWTKEVGET